MTRLPINEQVPLKPNAIRLFSFSHLVFLCSESSKSCSSASRFIVLTWGFMSSFFL